MQSHHFYQNTNTNIQQICKSRLAKKKVLTKPYKKKQSETTSIQSKIPRAVFLTCHDIFIHWLKWKSPNTNLCLPPFQHFSVAAKYFIYFFFSPQKDLPGQPLLKSTKTFWISSTWSTRVSFLKELMCFQDISRNSKNNYKLSWAAFERIVAIYTDMRAALLFVRPRLRLTAS